MNNRVLGSVLQAIGYPFTFSLYETYSSFDDKTPLRFCITAPLVIFTLPLSLAAIAGDDIIDKCNQEDFEKDTSHLPHLASLPASYAHIGDYTDVDHIKGYVVEHIGYADYDVVLGQDNVAFTTKELARQYLIDNGYIEVIDMSAGDKHYIYGTYWIKDVRKN